MRKKINDALLTRYFQSVVLVGKNYHLDDSSTHGKLKNDLQLLLSLTKMKIDSKVAEKNS